MNKLKLKSGKTLKKKYFLTKWMPFHFQVYKLSLRSLSLHVSQVFPIQMGAIKTIVIILMGTNVFVCFQVYHKGKKSQTKCMFLRDMEEPGHFS